MANLVEEKKYVLSSVDVNSNKVWIYRLFDDGSWESAWGRVGNDLQSKTFSGGKYAAEKKAREKLAKGYREVNVVGGTNGTNGNSSASKVVNNSSLLDIAKKQIQHSCPVVGKLIEYLTKVNAHQIFVGTQGKITYNDTTGLFQTPIGIVSKENIDEARKLLVQLGDFVANRDFDNKNACRAMEDYLMLIPQECPRKLSVAGVLPDLTAVQKQNSILDSLEASYASVISGATEKNDNDDDVEKDEPPKIFDVKLELLQDTKEFDRIKIGIDKTRHSVHACSHLKVEKVYAVEIKTMVDAFEKDGRKLSNIWELYHGSNSGNLLSILKIGLIIPPATSSYVTGRMFGPGAYFSSESSKSLNYSYGYWSGRGTSNNCFMFLADVAMGNYYIPSSSTSQRPPKGYDSYFAKPGKSGVMNTEMIVGRTSQVNLKYLVEFK